MKTNQLMNREFLGSSIRQRTDNSYFSANDLLNKYNENTGNDKKLSDFWKLQSTKEYLQALANELNTNRGFSPYLEKDLFIATRGRGGETWLHPYLFIEFAAWLSAEFRVKLYKWIYDNLIAFRNEAGDYYKDMCLAIQETYQTIYEKKPDPLIFIKEANFLNQLVFGINAGQRNDATEEQLELMNRLQKANIKLIREKKPKSERYKILRDIAIYN